MSKFNIRIRILKVKEKYLLYSANSLPFIFLFISYSRLHYNQDIFSVFITVFSLKIILLCGTQNFLEKKKTISLSVFLPYTEGL